jgi:hypothetical protein
VSTRSAWLSLFQLKISEEIAELICLQGVHRQSQGVRNHSQRSEWGVKSVARCAQIRNLTKGRRDCSGEQTRERKLRRESGGKFQGKESLISCRS